MKKILFTITVLTVFCIAPNTKAEDTQNYGPFAELFSLIKITDKKIAVVYNPDKTLDSRYVLHNNKKYGPYEGKINDFQADSNTWGLQIGEYFIIDSKQYGPYDYGYSDDLYIKNNFFAFRYGVNEKYYMNINETILGPYDTVGNLYVNDNKWIFSYSEDGKYYVNSSGEIIGPLATISHLYLSQNHYLIDIGSGVIADGHEYEYPALQYSKRINDDGWGYIFSKDKKNYVMYNGEEFGPYENFGMMFKFILDGSDWYLNYTMNEPKNFIKNGEALSVNQLPLTNNSPKYERKYDDGKTLITINNSSHGPYNMVYEPIFKGSDWAFMYKNEKNEYFIKTNISDALNEEYLSAKDNTMSDQDNNSPKQTPPKSNNSLQKLTIKNQTMHARLKGKIMLKIEDAGKAYYVHPQSSEMHYLGRPEDAFQVMREQGVGINNSNLEKIPIGLDNMSGVDSDKDGLSDAFEDAIGTDKNNTDSDGDGYSDKDELKNGHSPILKFKKLIHDDNFGEKQKGIIFLQVENKGEAWYINPDDGKRYFLGRPADAFSVMHNLGLGITNNDFDSMK